MSVFDYNDYKVYVNDWIQKQPKKGHGEYRRMALSLNISTTLISQVFKGDKNLSLEMACELGEYFAFSEQETEYFLLLVSINKAGSYKLKNKLKQQAKKIQKHARQLENRLKKDVELDETTKAVFYSSWIYSGIRLLTDLDVFNDSAEISKRLNLPRNQVQKILDFLIEHNLCKEIKGKTKIGPARTHLGASNLLASKHHQNWRLQGFNKMILSDDDNLFFTGPFSMSREVADQIRQELPSFIEGITKKIIPSESEVVRCFNIDWFEY